MNQKGVAMDVAYRAKIAPDKFKVLVVNEPTKLKTLNAFGFVGENKIGRSLLYTLIIL